MLQTFSISFSSDTCIQKKGTTRYNESICLRSRRYFIPFVDEIAIEFYLTNFIGSSWQKLGRKLVEQIENVGSMVGEQWHKFLVSS